MPDPPHGQGSPTPAERELLNAAQRGDQAAMAALIERYQHRVYSLCYRMTGQREWASDLAQDALVKVIEGLDSYDGRAQLSTWIIRVTMNVVLSKLRAEKHRRHASLDAIRERSGSDPDPIRLSSTKANPEDLDREQTPERRVEHTESRERLAACLLQLSEEHRAILLLRDARGLEYDQIGEILGLPAGTVKSRLFRARAAMRAMLEASQPPDTPH